ncbi:MAG TPA: class I SAM-dependent methyltransferase [Gemmatimonadales bacterium]|nr:class I SAM-dependent methyltransferase [Gemmatimonadales bacterium]
MTGGPFVAQRCPLCQGDRLAAHRFSLLRCTGCGLVVSPAIFRRGAAEALNVEAFGDEWEPETSFWVHRFKRWKNRRYLRTVQRYVWTGRLLEIGVGSGRFLEAARAAGFEVMGCDLSPTVCRRVEDRIGVKVHCSSVASLPEGIFDVVAMHHVLEHVEDPVGFLRGVGRVLAPGGIVHIAVPNVACWEARFSAWNCYAAYHLTYFDRATLARAVKQAGLGLVWSATHESFSAWFLTLVRAMLRPDSHAASRIRTPNGKASRLRRLMEHPYRLAILIGGAATWPLRRLQGALGRGDELVMVAGAAP